jgi:hypothetical protein
MSVPPLKDWPRKARGDFDAGAVDGQFHLHDFLRAAEGEDVAGAVLAWAARMASSTTALATASAPPCIEPEVSTQTSIGPSSSFLAGIRPGRGCITGAWCRRVSVMRSSSS